MADDFQNSGYKFLPYSMQKLTDLDPLTKVENYSREMNIPKLKEDIIKNIEMIFMSKSHLYTDIENLPEDVKNSVIRYGLDDYTGRRLSNELIMHLEANIIEQIKYYESRINPDTIEVDVKIKNNGYYCDMIISGDVNIPDIHETVKFQTSFNFETGLSTIKPL